MSVFKISLLDDHQLFLDGLTNILNRNGTWTVVNSYRLPLEFIEELKHNLPDLAIVDISMPQMSGLEVLEIIKKNYPSVKILLVTMHADSQTILRALRLKPNGIILKNASIGVLIDGIAQIQAGKVFYCEDVMKIILSNTMKEDNNLYKCPELSPRELEILKLLSHGHSNKEIAESLYLSVYTIDSYRKGLLKKMNAKNSAEMIMKAVQFSII